MAHCRLPYLLSKDSPQRHPANLSIGSLIQSEHRLYCAYLNLVPVISTMLGRHRTNNHNNHSAFFGFEAVKPFSLRPLHTLFLLSSLSQAHGMADCLAFCEMPFLTSREDVLSLLPLSCYQIILSTEAVLL